MFPKRKRSVSEVETFFSKSEYNRDLYLLVPEYAPDLEMMAARMERAISEEVGVETHILILTSNRLSDLRETDTPFYLNLLRTGYTLKGSQSKSIEYRTEKVTEQVTEQVAEQVKKHGPSCGPSYSPS
ncbi:hypothetical protein [Methanocalculus sp.]|uniref:hypothetical protein n=1 Tax=Methanocalculus sp. TaxID=2004547 RepID=UPI0025D3F5DD|nr:hypothetical protein [Methanocalculus sp.]